MDEKLIDAEQQKVMTTLPAFVNVLTILTFVGSGFGILGAIYNLITIPTQHARLEKSTEILEEAGGLFAQIGEAAMKAVEYAWELNTTAIISGSFCIIGALLMRKLKKAGFYLYAASNLVGVVVPMAIVGLMGGINIISAIFPVAFIIMYGVNLKYFN